MRLSKQIVSKCLQLHGEIRIHQNVRESFFLSEAASFLPHIFTYTDMFVHLRMCECVDVCVWLIISLLE